MNELVISSQIKQDLIIDYKKESIEKSIAAFEEKYKGVVITLEQEKEFKEDRTMLNKVAKAINDYRIDTEKRAKKPLEEFIKDFKSYKERIDYLSNSIGEQLKEFEEKELQAQYEIMLDIKVNLCEEQGVDEDLLEYIVLPEQKGELTRTKFNKKKATELIQVEIDKVLNDYKTIKAAVDTTNAKSNTGLNPKNYIKYLDDIARALQEIMNDEAKYLEMQEKIRIEAERKAEEKANQEMAKKLDEEKEKLKREQETVKETPTETITVDKTVETPNNTKEKCLIIKTKSMSREIALKLKQFLDDNNITYEIKEM